MNIKLDMLQIYYLEPETEMLVQAGSDGKVVETYKITYKGSEELSRE